MLGKYQETLQGSCGYWCFRWIFISPRFMSNISMG